MARLIVWFVLGAAVVGAVSNVLGAGPERIRALLLFPIAFGMLVGGGLAFTAREFGLHPRWLVAVLSCFLVSGGLLVIAWEAYQELVVMAQARIREDPTQLSGLTVLEQQADDPTFKRQYRELRMALDPQFEDYLMGRVTALGIWRSPWPAVIWIVEMLLATAAAGWLVGRIMAGKPSPQPGSGAPGAVVESTTGSSESGGENQS